MNAITTWLATPLAPLAGAWIGLAFCYAGMTAFCLAMDRHHAQVWQRDPAAARRRALRIAGWMLLALAALPCLRAWGASIGAVVWTGSLSAAALALAGLLAWHPRAAACLSVPATVLAIAGLAIA